MAHIQVLDKATVDKIAAGEVIERPASVVKELAENAIDAGAKSIVTRIEQGGVSLIRVTDDGMGIPKEEVQKAFLPHSTSKIRSIGDLDSIASLGFRGEALSSIAAVTKTELITKAKEEAVGTRYTIEGGVEVSMEDAGSPDGTTFVVRQLFYNVPARRKFLKSAATESGHIQELLIRLALSHPEISFALFIGSEEKLRTPGDGDLFKAIYSIYGRQVASQLLKADYRDNNLTITGFLGRTELNRANRSAEIFFVNGRYVKSPMLSKAAEDGYSGFVMRRRFPFAILSLRLKGDKIDVNVHPAKMEVRFLNQQNVYDAVFEAVRRTLLEPELIPTLEAQKPLEEQKKSPSPFLLKPKTPLPNKTAENEGMDEEYFLKKMRERVTQAHKKEISYSAEEPPSCSVRERNSYGEKAASADLFEKNFLKREAKEEYKLIGQAFDTYWIVEFQDKLYIIDQHAAHEKVLYERTMKGMKSREFTSQYLSPPLILSLSIKEAEVIEKYRQLFLDIGFKIEPFGGEEYAVSAVPANLFGIAKKELLTEMIDSLLEGINAKTPLDLIREKVASMSCKAAVKGNNVLSSEEAQALIGELFNLENPYNCPHGRPTIIAMTKRELDKKFKRIV